jgi:hypothetical protein
MGRIYWSSFLALICASPTMAGMSGKCLGNDVVEQLHSSIYLLKVKTSQVSYM